MISLIVAMSEDGVIGRDNQLPWHLSADLKRFKRLTTGHTIVMGRKTYESIGRPLPGRRTIVVTRNPQLQPAGVETAGSLAAALQRAAGDDELFLVGGSEIFRLGLPLAERLYLTRVHADVPGDVFFPTIDWSQWTLREEELHPADAAGSPPFSFLIYDRT